MKNSLRLKDSFILYETSMIYFIAPLQDDIFNYKLLLEYYSFSNTVQVYWFHLSLLSFKAPLYLHYPATYQNSKN